MTYLLPINGLRELSLKPLLVQILTDIGKMLGHSDDLFMQFKDEEPLAMVRSKNRNIEDDRRYRIVSSGEKINRYLHLTAVSMEAKDSEVYDPSLIRRNNDPILQDGDYTVIPSYRTSELKLTIKYYNDDKVNLQKKLDQVLLNLPLTQGKYVHDVDIRYPLGARLTALTKEIYSKKVKYSSSIGETNHMSFYDYLKTISSKRVNPYVNETKNKGGYSIVIKEKHRTIVGMLDTNLDSLVIEEEDNGYAVEFEYYFYIEHPFGFIVRQPLMVYNQMLDKRFIQTIKQQPKPDFNIGTYFFTNITNAVPDYSQLQVGTTPCYVIPELDDKVGIDSNGKYNRLFTRLVKVSNGNITLNINNISGKKYNKFELKREIVDFILKSEREYVTKYDRSLFFFTLTEDGNTKFSETLKLGKDGILRNITPLDMKKTYRVNMYVNMDTSYLNSKDKNRIKRFFKQDEIRVNTNTIKHVQTLGLMYNNEDFLFAPYEFRKQYLSTLNLIMLSYNISPRLYNLLIKAGYNREEVIFAAIQGSRLKELSLQIYHTDVLIERDNTVVKNDDGGIS